MITSSNSPAKGSGMPNHYGGDLLHTMGMSGLSRVRTELLHLVVIPAATPHPVQLDRQLPGHRDFGDLAPAAHGQGKELAAPLRIAAHCHLRGFHQQEAQQHVALLADVAVAGLRSTLPTAPAPRSWQSASRRQNVLAFQSLTQTPVRSANRSFGVIARLQPLPSRRPIGGLHLVVGGARSSRGRSSAFPQNGMPSKCSNERLR